MVSTNLVTILVAGLIINAVDVGTTLRFAAKTWNNVLQRQGILPSPFTPPFYITANFIGAAILVELFGLVAVVVQGPAESAFIASMSLWFVSRLYGAGHVVMGQMPFRLFVIMSAGLLGGYVCAGQYIAWSICCR